MENQTETKETCSINNKSCKTGACTQSKCSPCIISKIVFIGGIIFLAAKFFIN